MVTAYLVRVLITIVQIVLSFYGFWLVWRVLLPILPGPSNNEDRIAPFAGYFTDPLVEPVRRWLPIHPRWISAGLLILVAAGHVGLARLSDAI